MYKLKQILTGATFALITGLATMSGNALASTPDGETPANEGICDGLQGGTGGLYGLCVAYCEAQDLDTFNKKPPSLKILANYRKKMQPGDIDMPCVQVSCPCWTEEELGSINIDDGMCTSTSPTRKHAYGPANLEAHEAFADNGIKLCSYMNLNTGPSTIRTFDTTQDQANLCLSQVQAACVAAGQ